MFDFIKRIFKQKESESSKEIKPNKFETIYFAGVKETEKDEMFIDNFIRVINKYYKKRYL